MMDFLYTHEPIQLNENNVSRGKHTGFAENLQAAYDEQLAVGNSFSENDNYRAAYSERYEIMKAAGIDYDQLKIDSGMTVDRRYTRHGEREQYFDKYIRPLLPVEVNDKILTGAQLQLRAREIALKAVHENADIASRGAGFGATAGQMGGAMGGAMTDPVNIASMAFNPVGGIAKKIATEIAIGVLSEGLIQAGSVQNYRAELGLEHGFMQGLEAALIAGAGAGILRGGLELGGLAYKKAVLAAHRKHIDNPTVDEIAAINALEREIVHEELNPHGDTPVGRTRHDVMQAEADVRLHDDVVEPLDDVDLRMGQADEGASEVLEFDAEESGRLPVASAAVEYDVAEIVGAEIASKDLPIYEIARFVADEVKADLKRFPVVEKKVSGHRASSKVAVSESAIGKNGGAEGVVWQAVDGERIVVAGQKEIAKLSDNNGLEFDAHLIREVDGWTIKKVRQALRAKNSQQFDMPEPNAPVPVPHAGADVAAPQASILRGGAATTAKQDIDDLAAYGEAGDPVLREQAVLLERGLRQALADGDDFVLGVAGKDGTPTQTAKGLLDENERGKRLIAVLDACNVGRAV